MGRIFCFISLCFSSSAFGVEGLAGASSAIGIANTLQNKAQVNPNKAINTSKQAVKQIEKKKSTPNLDDFLNNPKKFKQEVQDELLQTYIDRGANDKRKRKEVQDELLQTYIDQLRDKEASQTQPTSPQNIQPNQDPNLILKSKEGASQNAPIPSVSNLYKSKSVILYKNDCSLKDKNCKRGAMLVNIKSVMFDYEQGRMKFNK